MACFDPHSYTDLEQGSVSHLDLKLKVDFAHECLRGSANLTVERGAGDVLHLDTRDLQIERIIDKDGNALKWSLAEPESFFGSRLSVQLPEHIASFTVFYRTGDQASALQWLKPEQTAGKEQPYLFSQCQTIHARSMVPLQDSPKVRFTYAAEIEVPKDLTAVMAAAPGTRSAGSSKDVRTFSFRMPQPIPSYLLAMAVGELECRDLGPRSRVYAEPQLIEAAAYEFAQVDSMLKAAEDLFGPYQWERFDMLVMPPSFPYGGMENPRLTFLTPTLLAGDRSLVNVLAHELAHSWTGNLVTNATMNDFWLNEGFTVWAERRILEKLGGKECVALAAAIGRNGLVQELERFSDTPELTHLKTDLSGRDPDDVYSLVPYEKGFLFVTALERLVGREAFDSFVQKYINEYQFQSITTEQFETFLVCHLPQVEDGFDREKWIRGPGVPDDSPVFHSAELERVEQLASQWRDGIRPNPVTVENWSATLWQIFLQSLPQQLPADDCQWLSEMFGLDESGNAEIKAAWLTIAAHSIYRPSFPLIEQFLGSVGRMKYLKPIYLALAKNEQSQDFAKELLRKHSSSYHPIARSVLEKIVFS